MSPKASSVTRWAARLETASLYVMYVLGTVLTARVWWWGGAVYVGYCLLANLLFMLLICPYCLHCRARSCHSGYHHIAKHFTPKEGRVFADQFRRNVRLMYPVWFVPPVAGIYVLIRHPSWPGGVLLGAFCLCGFVLVPYASKRICGGCRNAKSCPRQVGAA